MVTRLNINNSLLHSYIKSSPYSLQQLKEKVKDIELFISGRKNPTFNQVSKIAKIINIPTGLLLLDTRIEKSVNTLDFRTINSTNLNVNGLSPELKDTIKEMEVKQDFLKSEITTNLDFISKFSIESDYLEVTNYIKRLLNVADYHYYNKGFKEKPLNFFRSKISSLGIYVFFNGKVKDNTHRQLNINEFRGFVLVDKTAPIIFVNQKDSKAGQLFTLIHELVHLFIGSEGIFNNSDNEFGVNKTEAFVNKVTGEILVPTSELLQMFPSDISSLATTFRVSKFVVARRLLDTKLIDHTEYLSLIDELSKEFVKTKNIVSDKKTSGNYKNNLNFRMDKQFFYYIESALNHNKITYTEAFNVLGVGYKGYKTLREASK